MTQQLQAPIDLSAATRVGPKVYRKQVLAKRSIDYPLPDGTTQTVVFDDQYLRDLADAYNDGAYDLVPFQLATPANQHNEDPRNYGGRVLGAEVTDDGLDLILELADDTAELVERTGRRLGVSARIKAVQHVDGRRFKRAIRHVLGTLDPRMQNLKPWEPVGAVDLATEDDDPVLDLTGYPYQQEGTTMPQTIDLSALDPEDAERLLNLAALEGIDLAAATDGDEPDVYDEDPEGDDDPDEDDEPEGDDDPDAEEEDDDPEEGDDSAGITDDELDALLDQELGVSLSADEGDGLDLASGVLGVHDDERAAERDENSRLRFELAARDYAARGVPPHIVDLAEPVLALSDAQAGDLDLSTPTGEAVDIRGIVRGMLDAVAGTIDLSSETGYGHETEPDEQVKTAADAWSEYLENN